ncbi:MAG TPA: AbrB/MazE/SpoVT family DNA-binding domain-containing protein [Candidatus Kryptonia bacterium]|nr:AbrB/MazE/SpoVT family DNA-binding domain-containing protein [Candidatus Kryptonia bacterium]
MIVKVTAKRQVTFPARVLQALGVQPGDRLELHESPEGFLLRAQRIDRARLAPLHAKLRKGKGTFDVESFRGQRHDPALRD